MIPYLTEDSEHSACTLHGVSFGSHRTDYTQFLLEFYLVSGMSNPYFPDVLNVSGVRCLITYVLPHTVSK